LFTATHRRKTGEKEQIPSQLETMTNSEKYFLSVYNLRHQQNMNKNIGIFIRNSLDKLTKILFTP
jgi:hypothetical protein